MSVVIFKHEDVEIREISVSQMSECRDQTQYRCTPIGAVTDVIEVDINCPSGLYYLNDKGKYNRLSVRYEIALKRVGDGSWTVYKYEISAKTPNEIGFTHRYNVPTGIYNAAIYRLSSPSEDTQTMDKLFCNGLKSVIAKPVSYADVTTILMRIVGDQTLSEMNENQLATIWTRKLPNIQNAAIEKTSELAPAVSYIVNSSKYPDMIDSDSLNEFNKKWNYKGYSLNGVLDTDNTLLDVLRDVLNVGFSEPVIKGSKIEFTDQGHRNETDIQYIFQPQNITALPNLTVSVPQSDDVEEIVAEYMNPETWKTDQVFVSAADSEGHVVEREYSISKKQEKLSLFGVTSKKHAVSMAARRLNYLKFTKYTIDLKTELEGLNVSYNDFVGVFIDQFVNSEKTGRIVNYDSSCNEIYLNNISALSESEKNSLVIRDLSGKPYIIKVDETELVTSETGQNYLKCHMVSPLPFKWSRLIGSKYEYPFFVAGTENLMWCWVQSVQNSGQTCSVKLVNYDSKVYAEDIMIDSGWGHCPWGHCPWGHAGGVSGSGWGHAVWGHAAWGHF